MQIEMIKTKSLRPYKGNAKRHPPEQIQHICNSIEKFGFNTPILLSREKNTVIAGHGRLLAAKKLEMKEVPCIYLDELQDADWKAFALADNQISLSSGWNLEILNKELEGLLGFNLGDFGLGDFNKKKQPPLTLDNGNLKCPKCGCEFKEETENDK